MRHRIVLFVSVLASVGCTVAASQEKISYSRDVRPILSDNCFQCHGFDDETREAGLRLDTLAGATAELESGAGVAVAPGDIRRSLLIERITAHGTSDIMPPEETNKSLTESEVETLKAWIRSGASYEGHWSFVPPKRNPLPKVKRAAWPRSLIDFWVLARLENESISPAPPASRSTLIRRVALDLTGLPPTPAELAAFLSDRSVDAYEKMVDRYLASPRYGEHMAKHWLDLARYADSSGYQYDRERSMWVWRDWVIFAYNSNMPFDQFTIEQLAGDLLPNATPQQILATGFNRNHPITIEGGVIDEEYRTEYVLDRLNTTGAVWMGLTVGCARCHNHKYDPVSQREYYQMSAYFNQVAERGLNGFEPMQQIASPLAPPASPFRRAQAASMRDQIEALKVKLTDKDLVQFADRVKAEKKNGWQLLKPETMSSSGGSTLALQSDQSVLVGGANPGQDVYEIMAVTDKTDLTGIRLECLTHPSLPGGGPGRHTNSNFVLSEFELTAVSKKDPSQKRKVKFVKAIADYSQSNYGIEKSVDGTVANNNGWAVDGPTRKKPATAVFIADSPFGFQGGTELRFRLRHEASFETHGIGRPRLAVTRDAMNKIGLHGISDELRSAVKKAPQRWTPADRQRLLAAIEKVRVAKVKQLEEKLQSLLSTKKYPRTMVMRDLPKPRLTHVLGRGQYNLKQDIVQPGVPGFLNPMPRDASGNRLGLARWLVDPQHPLTARVAVNRYWQQLFGQGLVKTPEDFGTQGELPSHPELLDALAIQFVESGWDVKAMLRLILTSATYRQRSKMRPALLERDPENRLLSRGARFRLDAEQIRDQALFASGLLTSQIGGPSVYPYQPKGLWLELNNRPGYSRAYTPSTGDRLYRRSLYTFWKRTVLSPMMKTLDATGREFCTVQRSRTNTPLQALLLLQGPQFVEAARHLAARMLTQADHTPGEVIKQGFLLTTSRMPTDAEINILSEFYLDRLRTFRNHPDRVGRMLEVGESGSPASLDQTELAAWTEVARLLLNLDETINRD